MTSTSATGTSTDLLTQVIDQLRPHLARNILVRERLVTFWSFVMESRRLGASDVVEEDFRVVAHDCGLIEDLGWNGTEFLEHVLQWGLRGFNPFEKGPLQ
jgi:hypothetical protein